MPFTLDSLTFCDFQLKFDCLGLVTEALDLISLILILSLLSGSIPSSLPPVARPPAAPIQSTPTAGIQRIRVPAGVAPEHAISGARDEVRGFLTEEVSRSSLHQVLIFSDVKAKPIMV